MKLIYATLTCALSLILFSCDSSNNSTSTPNKEPAPTETQINTSNTPTPTTKLYNASVSKKGLDFSYEAEGKVSVVGKTITVSYENIENCDNGNIFRQQWEEVFNLDTNTLTNRTNHVSNCLRSDLPEHWYVFDNSDGSDRFTVTTEGNETVIKVDALKDDGTVMIEGFLVVRYDSNEESKSTVQTTDSTTVTSSEAVLTASDPDSQITLRANPSESSKSLGYGLVGDHVQVIEQTTTDDYTWHKVRFPRSGAVGWIRGDFVTLTTNQIPSESSTALESPTTSQSPTPSVGSPIRNPVSGSCECPYDTDKRGRQCGDRSAYSRPGGATPACYVGES
jgi:hypothetical protein